MQVVEPRQKVHEVQVSLLIGAAPQVIAVEFKRVERVVYFESSDPAHGPERNNQTQPSYL